MEPEPERRYLDALKKASAKIKTLLAENEALRAQGAIAVVGMGCRFPGDASDPRRFWDLLASGRDAVAEIPVARIDLQRWFDADRNAPGRFYIRSAALLDDVSGFDAGFFRTTPAEALALDPQQRLLLEVSWETFEDAGIDVRRLEGGNVGVFIGASNYDYIQAHIHSGDPARIGAYSGSGVMVSTAAGRLSYFYDLRGPCLTLDTACSSSLVAMDAAIKALRRRDCDLALAGGVSLMLSPDSVVALCKVGALAADGRCRPFDQAASGYGRGEGCGLLLLKRLEDARRDGDPIHAVLEGCAVNHDGRSNGLAAPNGLAQQAVIRAALADAGLAPDAIDYVEAHGTGTVLGDPIEFGALAAVFGRRPAGQDLRIGSVKSNIGHTEAAAGVAGVLKAILSLRQGALPRSLHFVAPNAHIDWDAASIRVVDAPAAWPRGVRSRRAGVSSFGLSGTNAHVVVGEAPERPAPPRRDERRVRALPISAATEPALAALAQAWRARLSGAEAELSDLVAAAARRTPLRHRFVAIGESAAELAGQLAEPPGHSAPAEPLGAGGPVFLFTGQGSAYAGMGRGLYAAEPVFRAALDRCAEVVGDALGGRLTDWLDDAAALLRTEIAQPAIFSLQWALTQLWASWGVRPAATAGHSVGEFAAAAAAGVFEPEAALRLVIERGRRMGELPRGGAMAAVFAAAESVAPSLAGTGVVIAAVNAEASVTLAGEATALERVVAALSAQGIESRRLEVSHAFHSPAMAPMVEGFRAVCAATTPRAARLPFYSTVTGAPLSPRERLGADYWAGQISAPVQFDAAIKALRRDRHSCFLEIGPGDALAAFARRDGALAISSLRRGVDEARRFAAAAAQLWRGGVDVDWAATAPRGPAPVAAPHYPFQRKPYWMEIGPLRPEAHRPTQASAATRPEGKPMEESDSLATQLVTILASVTGHDPADINPRQHLMDMGLDSLMLLRIGQAVKQTYGVELRMSQLFKELGTLADIAAHLAASGAHPSGGPAPIPAEASVAREPAPPPAQAPIGGEPGSLFQAQLQAMAQIAEQNLRSLGELTRQQLAALGAPRPDTVSDAPARMAPKPPEAAPRARPAPAPPARPAPIPVAAIRGINLAGARLTTEQQAYVEDLVRRHVSRTGGSKALTSQSRAALADWKHTLSFWGQLKEAKYPIVSAGSAGPMITDVDGNAYIDVAMGMGVHFFGHKPAFIHEALARQMQAGLELGTQSPLTGAAARLLTTLTGTERVAFSNTGSEVVMVALRLARAVTGRATVVLFKNSYHGIFDGVLATEEDGQVAPIGLGTPAGMIEDVVVLVYGSPEALDYIRRHGDEIAAVLVEPVQSRDPDLQPQGFLKALGRLTQACGAALIFDEMINGFRIHPGGARAWFGVDADIALYGKIVGGGLPIGVIAGKARFLDYIDGGVWEYGDRSGPRSAMIYFGGTFCRNPATMATTHAALKYMAEAGPAPQELATARTTAFCDRLNLWFERQRVPLRAKHFSSQWRLTPIGGQEIQPIELELLYLEMMVRGVYTWERRISFFSTAHEPRHIEAVFEAITGAIASIRAAGFAWSIESYPDPQFRPLTSPERRLYALSQREGGDRPYHLPQSYLIEGPLDVERLEEAFRTVIGRHESLRTAFVDIDGEALAKRVREPRFAIERFELGADGIEAAMRAWLRPFDLAAASLVRVAVGCEAAHRHWLMVDAHHIVADGLSFDIVAAELMAAYEGRPLPAVDYDLAEAHRAAEAGQTGAQGQTNELFWRTQLADLPELALPTDRPRPLERDGRGGAVSRRVGADLVDRLKSLGRRANASLHMTLLAAWSGFLHRLAGQDDIVVGAGVSGRDHAATVRAVGMFVNTVAFRVRPKHDSPFIAHLAAVANVCVAVYDHADYPFEAAAALARPPSLGRGAVFDAMLSYENTTGRSFQIEHLRFTQQEAPVDAAMCDLQLEATEQDGALTLRFTYASALFDRDTIERWSSSFAQMLAEVVDDPDRPLGRLDLLTPPERELIARFNATEAGYPASATLASLFAATVAAHGRRVAVIQGENELRYDELDRRSERLAAALASRAPAGAFVGVLLPRSEWLAVAELAILKAGCVFAPLDSAQPEAALRHILSDSACAAVIATPAMEERLPPEYRGLALDVATEAEGSGRRPRRPDDVAYVIYTSGSTGRPKGCLVTHRNAVRLLTSDRHPFAFGASDVWLCAHSFAFDFSIWETWGAWTHGGCVVIASADEARDPEALLDLLRRRRVSVLNQTPAAFYGLIEAERRRSEHDLAAHLHTVIFGGDRLEPAYLRPWAEIYPLDEIALVNMYGITETTVHVSHHRLTPEDLVGGRSPIGRPLPDTTIDVLGPGGLPQPVGAPGELWVGGGGVCAGYLNRPDLTAERFVTVAGRRLYRTGDVGRLRPDGVLDYIGRNDHQAQIRGHRVELTGVRRWLETHPGVEKAVVVDRAGSLDQRELVAYVIGDPGLTADELRAHLAQSLPEYAIPSHFVPLERLPLTDNGKLDLAALPPPERGRLAAGGGAVAPRTPREAAIAAIWAQTLGLPDVAVDQNYMALGGDSIKALLIVSRLHKAGFPVSLSQMFAAKTVAGLAALSLETAPATAAACETAPATPIQRWFAATHGAAPNHFNNAVLLAADAVDAQALGSAVVALVSHHDALRLSLDLRTATPTQRVAAQVAVPVEVVEVAGVAALTAHAAAAQRGFDIARPPLLRVVLYRLPGEDRVMLLCHHLAIDGVSWRILLEDLELAYAAARRGAKPELPRATMRWLDWSAALERAARDPALLAEAPYWAGVEAAPVPRLRPDYDDPVNAAGDAGAVSFEWEEAQTRRLLASAARDEAGVGAVLLAALALACRSGFGLERIRVRLEGHGREDLEPGLDPSRVIGWFTTIFPLVLEMAGAEDLATATARVSEALARTPRKGVGYGLLRYMAPAAPVSFGPPPEIGLNYLGQFESGSGGAFRLASEPLGAAIGESLRRPEMIDVEAMIVAGRLSVTVGYGRRLFARETAERFLAAIEAALSPPLLEDDGEETLALSPLQEGMVFHALGGDRQSYVQQFAYRISGPLDLDAFEAALRHLVARHDALRAAFVTGADGAPRQIVRKHRPIPIRREDLRALPAPERDAAVAALCAAEREGGFDLARDPLMRVALARQEERETEVIWTSHHIVMDGWSLGVLQSELMAIYEALAAQREPSLPPAPRLADYLDWLARRDRDAAIQFWTARLTDAPPPASIPGLDVAGREAGYALEEHAFELDADATRALAALAARLDVTVNTLVQGLWSVLLSGYAGSPDVMFGAIASGRPPELPGVERMVGLFLQSVPVRIRLAPDDSFATLVRRLSREASESEPFQHLPLAEIQRLGGKRRALFDHVLVFENYPFERAEAASLRVGRVRAVEQMHYDYGLVVHPGERLEFKFSYNRHVAPRAEFVRIEQQLRALAAAVLAAPERPLADINLGVRLAPAARPAAAGLVLDGFEAQAAQHPEATAIEEEGRAISYGALDDRADTLGRALRAAGVGAGAPIALFLPNGIDFIASALAAWKAGGAFVPFDIEAPPRRIRRLAERIRPAAWVTPIDLRDRLSDALGGLAAPCAVWRPDGAVEGMEPGPALSDRPGPADPAYVMFTSGSTGEPKAILSSHEALRHFIDWERAELAAGPGLRVANLALTTFDVSLRDIFLPLSVGGVCCVPPAPARADADALAVWLAQSAVEVAHVVPSLFRSALKALDARGLRTPTLRHVLFAGETLRGGDVVEARRVLGDAVTLRNLYGPSETTLAKCCLLIEGPVDPAGVLPVGAPLPGTRVLVVKEGRLAAPGAIGELYIAPPFEPLGYFRDPELTAERFLRCPPEWGDLGPLYRTGDLGRVLASGAIEVRGRLDGQVKVNGVRLELAEIEQAAMASPELDAAVAVAHPRGDGDLAVTCYYTLKQPIDAAQLRARMALELPRAAMPHFLAPLEAFPLNLNGKVDRRALPKPEELVTDRIPYVAAEGSVERRLVEIWSEVLGLRRVGVETSFFDVGGDSLRAIRVLTRANAEFGRALTIKRFFAGPTIREMAAALHGETAAAGRTPAAAPAADYPTSRAQRRLWVLAQLGGNPAAYTLPAAYLLEGRIDAEALIGALESLPERHEALRTVFVATPEGPRQRVLPETRFRVERLDLSDAADPDGEAAGLAAQHAQAAFDLAEGPLLAARLLALGPDRHVLLFNIHHIVCDAASVTVLVEELLRLARGASLPPPRLHYKDYAVFEDEWLRTPAAAAARDWWRRELAGLPEALDLPCDQPARGAPTYNGDRVSVELAPPLVAALRRLAKEAATTSFAGLLGLVAALLRRHAGRDEMVLGTPISCRDGEDLDQQVGFYVNMVPLRLSVRAEEGAAALIARVSAVLAAAIDHRAYPFDRLVEDLALARDDGRPPLFDVAVVYQDSGQRAFALDGVRVTALPGGASVAKFPLTFEFVETAAGLTLNLEYSTDLFDRARIERMAGHFQHLLASAAAAPEAPVASLETLGPAERATLLLPGAALALPQDATVPAVFADWVARQPDAPAVVCESARLTYAELDRRAGAVARALAGAGVRNGAVVAVLLERSEWLPVAFLGVLRAGAVYLPLDPTYPAERLRLMLADSSAGLLLTEPAQAGFASGADLRALDITALDATGGEMEPPRPDDVAYLIYTSGSTGRPKGVLLEHRGTVNLALAQRSGLGVAPGQRVLQFAPSSFDASVWEMAMALLNGGCLVVAGSERVRDPAAFAAYLARERVEIATLPPSYLVALEDTALAPLKLLVTAGEPPDASRALRLARTLTVVNAYGPTEATVCASWHKVDPVADLGRPIPIGRAIANVSMLVLDGAGALAPIGVAGEIHIGGAGLARGYLGRAALTEAAFVAHPFSRDARLYRTGDRGIVGEDGAVRFVGRADRQVKLRGFRIELGEVERAIARNAGVADVAAVARPDGELVAYVVPDGPLSLDALRDEVARLLPTPMTPTRWVELAALPTLPNGKIDYAALPQGEDAPDEPAAWRNGTEALVADAWRAVLGRGGFGRHDRLFAVGGDSIRAIQILGRIRTAGHAVEMRDFLAQPTVAGLAALLEAARAPAEGAPPPSARLGAAELEGLYGDG